MRLGSIGSFLLHHAVCSLHSLARYGAFVSGRQLGAPKLAGRRSCASSGRRGSAPRDQVVPLHMATTMPGRTSNGWWEFQVRMCLRPQDEQIQYQTIQTSVWKGVINSWGTGKGQITDRYSSRSGIVEFDFILNIKLTHIHLPVSHLLRPLSRELSTRKENIFGRSNWPQQHQQHGKEEIGIHLAKSSHDVSYQTPIN